MTTKSQPSIADSPDLGSDRATGVRQLPVGAKFAAVVVGVLLIAGLAIAIGLSRVAREQLVQAKLRGAEMIVDNVALALAPALDFDDRTAVSEYAERLGATRDVVQVVVWSQQSATPVFSKASTPAPPLTTGNENRTTDSAILLSRALVTPLGTQVGNLRVQFSLNPENQRFRQVRANILLLTGGATLSIAAMIILIARLLIVKRVQQLLAATIQLRLGRDISVPTSPRDELGELAFGFNEMAREIRDRERKLSIERDKSHELLDNMRQAILVTDPEGQLTDVRSRQAEVLFGADKLGCRVADVLCDASRPAVERQAFDEWIAVAFRLGFERWSEVAELAPTEAIVRAIDGRQRVLTVDTRPIVLDGQLIRIMFLCTDVTSERALEKAVQEREEEHDRQMRVMRALAAGHGLQLVATLRNVEARVTASERIIAAGGLTTTDLNEIFQYVHSIKGDASAYELEILAQAAAVIEGRLTDYRAEAEHGQTSDTASMARELAEGLRRLSDALQRIREMLVAVSPVGSDILDQVTVRSSDLVALDRASLHATAEVREVVNRLLSQPFGELVGTLVSSAQRWAQRLGKQVTVEIEGGNHLVPRSLAQALPVAMTHLVRNAVSHGIETPQERQLAGKPETGAIRLQCRQAGHDVEIHVVDDGRGLDEQRLRELDPSKCSGRAAAELAFLPGLSTADASAAREGIAGFGVGLGAVRSELARLQYRVELLSTPGRGVDVRVFRSAHDRAVGGAEP